MRPLFEHYRGLRPVYAIDLPGYGFSDRGDRRYTPELFKRAILDLTEREIEGVLQPDVIALSLSCEFAALAALERPRAIRFLTMISPTGFGEQTMSLSESRRKGLSIRLWSQAFYDLIASRSSIRFFLKKSFVGTVPEELIEYAYNSSHQPGARFAPLYFLGGQLFTRNVRREIYSRLKTPTLVVYDHDAYTTFEHLRPFLDEHGNWAEARIDGTRGMPHWERLAETVVSLDYFETEKLS
jgi:pimeloyl-ACP methyl ester carboxylesterase